MELGWVGYGLLGVTKIAFLENLTNCAYLVSIMDTYIYSIFIVILIISVRCKYVRAL